MTLVNLDKVKSGAVGNLESVIVYDKDNLATEHKDFVNGLFVAIKGLAEGEREALAVYPTAKGDEAEILMVHSPELDYDERLTKEDFVNKKGKVARAYHLAVGDIIQVTEDLVPDSTAKGHLLAPKAKGALEKISSITTETLVFEVMDEPAFEISTNQKSVTLRVVKA